MFPRYEREDSTIPKTVPSFQAVVTALAAHFGQPLDQPTVYVRLSMPHFDDLVIERIGAQQISVAHYQTIDSDRIANPEVVIFVTTADAWIPITISLRHASVQPQR